MFPLWYIHFRWSKSAKNYCRTVWSRHVSVHVSLVAKIMQTEFAKCFSARGFSNEIVDIVTFRKKVAQNSQNHILSKKKLSKFWFDKIYRALLFEMQILKNVILNKSYQKREKAHRFLGVFLRKTFLDNNMALSNYSNSKTLSFIHSLSGH